MNLNVEYIFNAIDNLSPVIKKISTNFNTHINDMSRNLKSFGKNIMDFGKKMKWISAGASVGVWKALKESMNFEESQIMFETLIGSAERGKQLVSEIDILAKKTPMGNRVLRESAQTMLAYGVNVENIIPSLKRLGDISGGNNEKFKVLAYNFSQIASLGKLTAVDLKSLTLAGFNPLKIISEKTGYSMEYLSEAMRNGQITFKMVEQAMKDATSEGGRFFKLMEKRSVSASGALDEFRDTFNQVARVIGDDLKPAFTRILRMMTKFLEWFKNINPNIRKMISWTLALTAIIAPLIIAFGGLVFVLGTLAPAISIIGSALSFLPIIIGTLFSPLVLIVAGVMAVIGVFIYWKEIILELDKFLKFLWEDLKIIGEWISSAFNVVIDSVVNKFKMFGDTVEKLKFWKKDLAGDELLEVNKNIEGIGGKQQIDIKNLLTIENKNDSKINYTPMPVFGAGKSMAY